MSVTIQNIVVGPIDTNCYIVADHHLGEAFLIDPGIECEPVMDALGSLRLTDILLTHAHFDHIGGVARLVDQSGARVWVHEAEAEWLTNPIRNLSAMVAICDPITAPEASVLLHGGERVILLGQEFEVTHTPGHTPGHVVYRYGDVVFVGDLIFQGSIGRTDFPGGSFDTLVNSISTAVLSLPDATRLLPGHGPATTVGHERRHNPFLQ